MTDEEKEETGRFQSTEIVEEAWQTTLACANALWAKTILFQCPASFKPYTENISNLENFFTRIKRGKLNFAWEPRGDWKDEIVKDICERHDLWHVVDPFKNRTVTPEKCYYRLHGMTGWRYKYETGELEELVSLLPAKKRSYVFFNNIEMNEDALRFKEIIKDF